MKLAICLSFALQLWTITATFSQAGILEKKIHLHIDDRTIVETLQMIERAANVQLSYSSLAVTRPAKRITLISRGRTLESVLKEVLGEDVRFQVDGNSILIGPVPKEKLPEFTVSGSLRDAQTGEALIGATVQVRELPGVGVAGNVYGFYALNLPAGDYHLVCSYVGYEALEVELSLRSSKRLDLSLSPAGAKLAEVIVRATTGRPPVNAGQRTGSRLDLQKLKTFPTVAGEPDLFKLAQTLPGVKSGGDGSSALHVRGGNLDQNLILLDEAPVYNPAHFLGFFSSFNPDAIHHAQLYKSHFPAQYGGRLSSVFDLRMKEGNKEESHIQGGAGLLASRIFLEGPIQKQKSSYMFSARRTYPDLLFRLASDDGGNKAHFYDLNAKVNAQIGPRDHIYLSGYFGKDVFRYFDQYENTWSNATFSLRWNRLFSDNLFSNFSLIGSRYRYYIDNFIQGETTYNWQSGITNLHAKANFSWYQRNDHILRFGFNVLYIRFDPGSDTEQRLPAFPSRQGLESALYFGHEWAAGDRLSVHYGLRLNLFQNLGPAREYRFDENNTLLDSVQHDAGSYGQFWGWAPRLNLRYQWSAGRALEISYNRTYQYIQELRNSTSSFSAFYIWAPSGPNLPDQAADQVSAGYFHQLSKSVFSLSVELYYKWLYRQVDFADHAQLLQNPYLEGEIRVGKGRAYGLEFQVEKNTGSLTGWLNYTFSRTLRKIPGINEDRAYPAYYDLPHAVNLNIRYEAGPRWHFGLNWQFASGKPATFPLASFQFGETVVPIYGDRNSNRLPAYHRLDLSATLHRREKPGMRNHSYWTFSVYNAYFRKNALSVDLLPRRDPATGNVPDPTDVRAYKTYVFAVLPSLSYHFKF